MAARFFGAILIVSLAAFASACGQTESDALPNVRLGMSPRDVRDRLVTGGDGTWTSSVGAAGDDASLEWSGSSSAHVEHARFEFHGGMLVAIRARVHDDGTSSVHATAKTVVAKRAADKSGDADITVLSRDCPTHHVEAESLASSAR